MDVVSQTVRPEGEPEVMAQMRRGTSPREADGMRTEVAAEIKRRRHRHPNHLRTGAAGVAAAAAAGRRPREVAPIYDKIPGEYRS